MRILHVTRSDAFAGTERYAAEVCRELADLDHDVTLVGGEPHRMSREAGPRVRWLPGSSTATAARSILTVGRADVVHAHLTAAEVAAVATRWRHRGLVVATRHIAADRGAGRKRLLAPLVERGIDIEIAISLTVDNALRKRADEVLHNGVRSQDSTYDPSSRTVLVLQRLEPQKRTHVAIEAWRMSGLAQQGWNMQIAGEGSERAALMSQAAGLEGIEFLGHVDDVAPLLRAAGIVMAPAEGEGLGLTVLEAMAWARPVLAARSGGHLETLPSSAPMFAAGDPRDAATHLRALAADAERRRELATVLQDRQRTGFTLERHVCRLVELYSA